MIIPLPQTNSGTLKPATFAGSEARVMPSPVNMSGVEAPRPIQVDPRMAQLDAAPMAAFGQLGKDIGEKLYQIKMERNEAENRADLADARLEMDAVNADFDSWKLESNADPREWEAAWKERSDMLRAKLEGNDKYSPVVREALDAEMKKWNGRSLIRLNRDATKAAFQRAREADTAEFLSLADAERYDDANALISSSKYIPADDKVRYALDLRDKKQAKEEQRIYDGEVANIYRSPREWLEERKAFQPKDEKEARRHELLTNRARGILQDDAQEATGLVYDEMAKAHESGRVLTDADIEKFASDRLSPASLAKLKATNAEYLSDAAKMRRSSPEYQTQVFGRVNALIDEFDPTKDGDKELVGILDGIQEMSVSRRAEMRSRLDAKRKPEPVEATIHDAAEKRIKELIYDKQSEKAKQTFNTYSVLGSGLLKDKSKLLKAGLNTDEAKEVVSQDSESKRKALFLQYAAGKNISSDTPPFERAAFQAILAGEPSWSVTDEEAKTKAEFAHGTALKEYREWARKNPDADDKAASSKLSEIIGTKTSVNVAPKLPGVRDVGNFISGAARIDFSKPIKLSNYGYESDSTPDTNSKNGIGHSDNRLTDEYSAAVTKSLAFKLGLKNGDEFIAHTSKGDLVLKYDDTVPAKDSRTGSLPETVDIYRKQKGSNDWGGKVYGISKK